MSSSGNIRRSPNRATDAEALAVDGPGIAACGPTTVPELGDDGPGGEFVLGELGEGLPSEGEDEDFSLSLSLFVRRIARRGVSSDCISAFASQFSYRFDVACVYFGQFCMSNIQHQYGDTPNLVDMEYNVARLIILV